MTEDRKNDGLDPEIRSFVKKMGELWREHPSLSSLPLPEQRRVAEKVRSYWSKGGPVMARTTEKAVPTGDGKTVRIRLLDPTPQGPKPALLYLHGGGWTIFSIDTHDRIMREYAARAGMVVIGIDYSLSPEAKFPRALDETVAVVRWLRENGAAVGVDHRRIVIGGDSAGAAMTIASCVMLRDAGELGTVKGMLLNYGAFDVACDTESYDKYGKGGYLWDEGEMAAFWNNYLRDDADRRNPLAVPMLADVSGLPPALLATPDCDVMYSESVAMGEKLRRAGVLAQTAVYPGATHSFLEAVSVARVTNRAYDEAARWLKDMVA